MRLLVALSVMMTTIAATPAAPPARGSLPEKGDDLAAFFRAMDANGDGAIDRAEFDHWFSGSNGQELAAYYTMMDADRDGRISEREFTAFNARVDRSAEGD